jgi:hypothetical protein
MNNLINLAVFGSSLSCFGSMEMENKKAGSEVLSAGPDPIFTLRKGGSKWRRN